MLLLLHAFPLNHTMWQPQIDALAPTTPLLALDYAGFGASQWHPTTPPDASHIDDVAASIVAELDRRSIAQVAVAGLSMGGYVALALWRIAPQRISGLAICNSRASGDDAATKAARVRNAHIARTQGAAALTEVMMPRLLSQYASPALYQQVRDLGSHADPEAMANAMLMIGERPDATALLPTITVPSLVIGATDDPIITVSDSAAVATALPNAQCVILPQCGHLSNLEYPTQFTAALQSWLQRIH